MVPRNDNPFLYNMQDYLIIQQIAIGLEQTRHFLMFISNLIAGFKNLPTGLISLFQV